MSDFLTGLESSGWLRHIKAIVDAAVFLTKVIIFWWISSSLVQHTSSRIVFFFCCLLLFPRRWRWRGRACWFIAQTDGTEQPKSALLGLCWWIPTIAPSRALWCESQTLKQIHESNSLSVLNVFFCCCCLSSLVFLTGADRERLDLLWSQVCTQVRV